MTKQYLAINRDYWNGVSDNWVAVGERLWGCTTPEWGIWGLPETELGLLPTNMKGMNAIELGCGTGYVSGWMARRGARVTGVDMSAAQLLTARRLAQFHNVDINFVESNAETVECDSESFDFAISEYGAAIWCDPDVWLREAWRLLRPGGELVFLGNHPFAILCAPKSGAPCDFALHRPYRNLTTIDWTTVEIEPGGIEFNRGFSSWLNLFKDIGFAIRDFQELYAPESAKGVRYGVSADWAQQYPVEQVGRIEKIFSSSNSQ